MDTYWRATNNSLHYLHPANSRNPLNGEFYGAFGETSRGVYTHNGSMIALLPDDLILDEALAAAKVLIMANRRE